ncbi:MAG TPA: ABC transporter ATP-binding protein [bacterium]|nr:ABC transporter ATP-binding protein [bacterium]
MSPEAYGISIQDLSKRMGTTQALQHLSIEFEPGMMHGLIGPEGAGKTTLMRLMAGLLHPDSGSVSYRAGEQQVAFAALRPLIAYMPQQQSLYADLSVAEHLDFFRTLYGLADEEYRVRRAALLAVTQLERFLDRPAGALSGGMYKKLGLMCSLLSAPRVLLLDEPTNGVDPISRREFWELLYHLQEQRILIVLATAYMDEAERCARAHLMQGGALLASGEPRELLRQAGAKTIDELFLLRTGE